MTELAVAGGVIVAASAVSLWRIARGPTVYDRLLAAGAVGTKAIALLALIGFIFDRPDMFVDLAITYALLNFIGTLAAAKYIENHAQVPIPSADSGQPLTFPLEGEERQRTEKQEGGRTP